MARTASFSQVLWLLPTAGLAGCGRLGFDDGSSGASNHLPDAMAAIDAAIDAPPVGPKLVVGTVPAMTAECGMAVTTYDVPLSNPGDQDLVITQVALDDATTFAIVNKLPMTIPAGGAATMQVQPPASMVGTDRAKTVKTNTLNLTTNVPGGEVVPIAVSSTVMGANFDVVIAGGGGKTMNLTTNDGTCPADRTITVTNSGNVSMAYAVQPSLTIGVTMSGFSSGAIGIGKAATTTFKAFTPSGACHVDNGQLKYTGNGASGVCTADVTITVNMDINSSSTGVCNCP